MRLELYRNCPWPKPKLGSEDPITPIKDPKDTAYTPPQKKVLGLPPTGSFSETRVRALLAHVQDFACRPP